MLTPRFASGVPSTDTGFQKFAGRFMDIGKRVGTLIRRGYVPMFSTSSKTRRASSTQQDRHEPGHGAPLGLEKGSFGARLLYTWRPAGPCFAEPCRGV